MNARYAIMLLLAVTTPLAAAPRTEVVRSVDLPVVYRAVGTVRPRIEANVAAQASGRLLTLQVREGTAVEKGETIATIEDNLLTLQLTQASGGLEAAQAQRLQAEHGRVGALAGLTRAQAEFERVKKMHAQSAATDQQFEQAQAAFKQAQSTVDGANEAVKAAAAAVKRATAAVDEVNVALGYTKVTAPFAGVVTRRLVDVGDLAWPGRPLVVLVTATDLRIEANIREGLAGHVHVGQTLAVAIDATNERLDGTVEQIVPAADPTSRTFVVKVALPPGQAQRLPGMFARLTVPTGLRRTVTVPRKAVSRLGQLCLVSVQDGGRLERRLVRLGETVDDDVEVLAGLREGETIALPSAEEVGNDR